MKAPFHPVESGSADICGGTITYTWEYTDPCGNNISHTQDVEVTPAPAPAFINPPGDIIVDCDNIPTNGPDLDYTNGGVGSCLFEGTISPIETGSADICGGTITYTWEYTDPCGNNISHTQNVEVTPAPAPAFINPPGDIIVDCDNIPTNGPDLDYTNGGVGSCLFEGTISPIETGSADICGGTITYTWEYTDPCGNNISHTQNVEVTPAPAPAFINPPGDIIVDCDNIPTNGPDLDYTNGGVGSCLFEGTVSPVETGSADICGGTITYTWEYTDPCGNFIFHTQIITVTPAPPIMFVNPPQNINVSCENVPVNPGGLQYTNNGIGDCLIEGDVQATQSGSYDVCGGTLVNTWQFTSECGQTINHVQNIHVDPAPQAVFVGNLPQDITVNCNTVPIGAPSLNYSNNALGICQIEGSVSAQQTGFYDECGGSLLNTWSFVDECGRLTQHLQFITVEPAPIASFIDLPGPQTVNCTEVPVPPMLSYSNNSSGICSISGSVPAIQSGSYGPCGGNLVYTWTFTDNCNRSITHSQNITVNPASDPVFVDPPEDINIDCGESLPTPETLVYTNNESGNCSILGSTTATVNMINDQQWEYIWTYINPCTNNAITHIQVVNQSPAPVITLDPNFVTICEGTSFDLSTIIVTDNNNSNPTITFHDGTPASSFNEISPIVSPGLNTTYYLLATNSFGCSDEASFELFLETPPDAGLDGEGDICFSTPTGINLFDYLGGTPDLTGEWSDPDFTGVDLSFPFNVSLAGHPPGTYNFVYTVYSNGACPDATATVTLEYLPEIVVDILDIACTDDLEFYDVFIQSNGMDISVDVGNLNDLGNGEFSITDIPVDQSLSIIAANPGQFFCVAVTSISPPDCGCPTVDPPVNNGNPAICDGQTIPELSVTVGVDETANWYDAASGGTLLIAGSTTYTPTNTNGPGVYTYYVQAEDLNTECLSSVLTPVQLEIYANPAGNDAALDLCDDDDDGFVEFNLTEAQSSDS